MRMLIKKTLVRLLLTVVFVLALTSAASAQDPYRIRAGDVLRIEVLEDPNMNRSVLVSPDGRISLPLAGSVQAAGRTLEQVHAGLAAGLGPSFASGPTVFVSLERLVEPRVSEAAAPAPLIDVFVVGAAEKPGKISVAPGANILQVFAQMGGFSRFAALKRVQLRRLASDGTEQVFTIDYDAITRGGRVSNLPIMAAGDVIVVPERRLFE